MRRSMPLAVALAVVVAAVTGLLLSGRALAGGWSIVRPDEVPRDVIAGTAVHIGFTVLQHGVTPMADLKPLVLATHVESGVELSAAASSQGEPGHYTVVLTLPEAGAWDWSVDAFEGKHPMPRLNVKPTVSSAPVEAHARVEAEALASSVQNSSPVEAAFEPGEADEAIGEVEITAPASNMSVSREARPDRRLALGFGAAGGALLLATGYLAGRPFRRARPGA